MTVTLWGPISEVVAYTSSQSKILKKEKHKFKLGISRNAYCFSAVDFTSSLLSFTLSNHHHHPIVDLPCAGGGRGSEVRLWARRVGVRQRHEPILAGEPCSRRLCGEDIWHARAGEPHTRSWWSAGWHGGNIARPNHQQESPTRSRFAFTHSLSTLVRNDLAYRGIDSYQNDNL